MTPLERYLLQFDNGDFSEDPAQKIAVEYTHALYDAFMNVHHHNKSGIWDRLIRYIFSKNTTLNKRTTLLWWSKEG